MRQAWVPVERESVGIGQQKLRWQEAAGAKPPVFREKKRRTVARDFTSSSNILLAV